MSHNCKPHSITLLFQKIIVSPAEAQYSYLSVSFRVRRVEDLFKHQVTVPSPLITRRATSIHSNPDIFLCFLCLLGIYDQEFAKLLNNDSRFFEDLSKSVNDTWKERFEQNVTTYFQQSLIDNIARAAIRMLK